MKFIQINKIKNVHSFNFINNKLYYSRKGIIFSNNYEFDSGQNGECTIENLNGVPYYNFYSVGIVDLFDRKHLIQNGNYHTGNFILVVTNWEIRDGKLISNYNLYDYKNEENILKNDVQSNIVNIEDRFFCDVQNENNLTQIDRFNEVLWQFTLSILGNPPYEDKSDEIEKILGIAHGNIWFNTRGGRLVVLNLNSGNIVKKYSGHTSDSALGYTIIRKVGWVFFDAQDQSIKCISSFDFQSINTRTFQVETGYNYYEADPLGIAKYKNVYSPLLQGDYFTFLAEKEEDYGGIRHVGIFDYRKQKLIWEWEVITKEECKQTRNHLVRPQPLYMSGDKLYIKDFENTLHIFERHNIQE